MPRQSKIVDGWCKVRQLWEKLYHRPKVGAGNNFELVCKSDREQNWKLKWIGDSCDTAYFSIFHIDFIESVFRSLNLNWISWRNREIGD